MTIVWIDTETTGLDPETESLLEVACIITRDDLTRLYSREWLVAYDVDQVWAMHEKAGPYVQEMHTRTGLWNRLLRGESTSLRDIDAELSEVIATYSKGEEKAPLLGGNSVHFDREFMKIHLPLSESGLHYRNLDMSSVEPFLLGSLPGEEPFPKLYAHAALEDIEETLAQAGYWRDFVSTRVRD